MIDQDFTTLRVAMFSIDFWKTGSDIIEFVLSKMDLSKNHDSNDFADMVMQYLKSKQFDETDDDQT